MLKLNKMCEIRIHRSKINTDFKYEDEYNKNETFFKIGKKEF